MNMNIGLSRGGAAEWLNSALSKVYMHMSLGLLVTVLSAFLLSTSQTAMAMIFKTPLAFVVMLTPLVLVWFISANVEKYSITTLRILFYTVSVIQGLCLSTILMVYTTSSILGCLLGTVLLFASMSIYGYFTKRNIESISQYLFMALIGIIIAMIINIFLASNLLTFIISIVGILLFLALTAYDTQKIKKILWNNPDADRAIVLAALTLYLDFVNIMLFVLQLFGIKKS